MSASPRLHIRAFAEEFERYRSYCDRAVERLTFDQLRETLDPQANSIAVVMKHVAGNLRSRWTDPFTTDGEKPWRNRDHEFIDDFADRAELAAAWDAGWSALRSALAGFDDADLTRLITIRAEPMPLARALTRSVSHTSYHAGQIVQTARVIASRANLEWTTLTIPRGGSEDFNRAMGHAIDPPAAPTRRP